MRTWPLLLLLTALLSGCGYRDFQQLDAERLSAWQTLLPLEQQRAALALTLLASTRALPGIEAAALARLDDARKRALADAPAATPLPADALLLRHVETHAALAQALTPVLLRARGAPGLSPLVGQFDAIDNRIAVAYSRYNLATQRHNALLMSFPSNLTALGLGLQPRAALPPARP